MHLAEGIMMRRAPLSAASVTIVHPQGFLAPLATIATDSTRVLDDTLLLQAH